MRCVPGVFLFSLFCLTALYSQTQSPGEALYQEGLKRYGEGKLLLANGAFQKAVEAGYQNPLVFFYLGNCQVKFGSYDKAVENFRMASELTDSQALKVRCLFNIGFAQQAKLDFRQALQSYGAAEKVDPAFNVVYWQRGMTYYSLKDKENTILDWEKYLALAPNGSQSSNIREALAILKATNFSFENPSNGVLQLVGTPGSSSSAGGSNGPGGSNVTPPPLVDVEGVLEEIRPGDQGKISDDTLEELED